MALNNSTRDTAKGIWHSDDFVDGMRVKTKLTGDKIGYLSWNELNGIWGVKFDDGTYDLYYPNQIIICND